jgi:hypothetical protein
MRIEARSFINIIYDENYNQLPIAAEMQLYRDAVAEIRK